jgi:hypothetical protein
MSGRGIGYMTKPDRSKCPSCGGTLKHRSKCELKDLSIEEAAVLGLEEARKVAERRRK